MCMGLCLYQISKICEMYFSYKTTISMSYENISQISLPALSICVDKSFLLKPKYLTQLGFTESDQRLVQNWRKIGLFLANMTIKEQFNAMFSKDYIFQNSCHTLPPRAFESTEGSERYINCENVSPIKISMNIYWMCFTLFSQTEGESDDRYVIDYSQYKFQDFSDEVIYMNINEKIQNAFVFLHSRKESLWKYSPNINGVSWSLSKDFTSFIIYKKILTHSLPLPFNTNCYDYANDGYISGTHCIALCRLKHWKQFLGDQWPGYYFTSNQTSDQYMADIYEVFFGSENKTIDKEIGIKCAKECKSMTNCYQETYDVKFVKYHYSFKYVWIRILPPYYPDQIIRHSPKMIFEEFVCLIGSLIGLYFGFSLMMLFDVCLKIYSYFKNNYTINQKFKSCTNQLNQINVYNLNLSNDKNRNIIVPRNR